MRSLYEHQAKAVQQLISNKRFLLAHSCGTGKTLSALTAAKHIDKPVIVVCPESAKVTWEEENKDTAVNIEAMFNYSSFKDLKNKDIKGRILIYDEAHHLAHMDSQRTKQALALTDYDHMFGLSGTVCPDKPLDLYSILLLLGLREKTKTDFYRFRSKYAIMQKKRIGWKRIGNRSVPRYVQEIVGWKNLEGLREEIAPKSSFLKLEQVTDMPPATLIPVKFELTPGERKEYSIAQEGHFMGELALCSEFAKNRIWETLNPILEAKEKVVIFSGFLDTVKSIVRDYGAVELIGETKDREGAVESFRGPDEAILATTYHTGSESLNLQCARYTIFTDLPNYLLQFRQALSRTYRTGQTGSVIYYFMIPKDTIVEEVFDRLVSKFDLVKTIFVDEDLDIMNMMQELRR
jgi:superfamily II DNA or RNA helicase